MAHPEVYSGSPTIEGYCQAKLRVEIPHGSRSAFDDNGKDVVVPHDILPFWCGRLLVEQQVLPGVVCHKDGEDLGGLFLALQPLDEVVDILLAVVCSIRVLVKFAGNAAIS